MADIENPWHSRPIDVHRWSDHPEVVGLADAVWEEYVAIAQKSGPKPKTAFRHQLRVLLLDPASVDQPGFCLRIASFYDVVSEPLPVVVRADEPLILRGHIFCLSTGQPTIKLSYSSPFLKLLNVWWHHHCGNLIWSTMDRFCSSEIPAE